MTAGSLHDEATRQGWRYSLLFSLFVYLFQNSQLSLGWDFDNNLDNRNGASDATCTEHPLSSISLTKTVIVIAYLVKDLEPLTELLLSISAKTSSINFLWFANSVSRNFLGLSVSLQVFTWSVHHESFDMAFQKRCSCSSLSTWSSSVCALSFMWHKTFASHLKMVHSFFKALTLGLLVKLSAIVLTAPIIASRAAVCFEVFCGESFSFWQLAYF